MNLTPIEARVLGSLVEKDITTPDYYPLSLNALVNACNQKNNRDPVMTLEEDAVRDALAGLQFQRLAGPASGADSRVTKYEHRLQEVYNFSRGEIAVLCVLLLRGPQTPGELNTNSGRMHEFDSLDEVQEVLERLSSPEMPFLVQLPRRPGQKEVRYAHLLGGVPEVNDDDFGDELSPRGSGGLEARVVKLETELAALRAEFDKLMKELS